MADGAVKAARIRPQSSSLNVFWAASTLQTPGIGILAAIGHAAARLNPSRGISRGATGRHAAPARGRRDGLADIPHVPFARYRNQFRSRRETNEAGQEASRAFRRHVGVRGPRVRDRRSGQRELPRPGELRREHAELRQRHLRRLTAARRSPIPACTSRSASAARSSARKIRWPKTRSSSGSRMRAATTPITTSTRYSLGTASRRTR